MAKQPKNASPLTFLEIVMRADAETIKAAYEARVKVDELLAQREEAYRRIAEIETQVETVVGEEGVFVFPAPPVSVFGMASPAAAPVAAKRPVPPKARPEIQPPAAPPEQ